MDQISKEILLRYALPCPRYTSYPVASAFHDAFGPHDSLQDLRIASLDAEPLWLYVQLPACRHRPACGCDAALNQAMRFSETYLQGIQVELALVAEALDERRSLQRLHLDGDIASLGEANLQRLWSELQDHFRIEPDCELGFELGCSLASTSLLLALCSFGFSRLRLKVEHHDQHGDSGLGSGPGSFRLIADRCRALGFDSLDVDLLYALPGQDLARLDRTLTEVLSARPSRVALQNLASLPSRFACLRGWDPQYIPDASQRLELQLLAHDKLSEAGYRPVGYEHFALPSDRLCQSLDRKELHRGLMGFCSSPAPDLIGLGAGAVSEVQGAYCQNASEVSRYLTALSQGRLPVVRGYRKEPEDELRGEVIQRLLCLMEVDLDLVAKDHGFGLEDFGLELDELTRLSRDGLVELDGASIRMTRLGRLAAGVIAQLFDRHARP